jgi:HlyD family secretion protein
MTKTKTIQAAASVLMLSTLGVMELAPRSSQSAAPNAVAREGSLTETLVEPGTLSSARLLLYGSSIAGVQAKIAELVPEGRAVVPGDVLIRFDATTFEQNMAREEAALRQAQAELVRAREELRIERIRVEGETSDAERQVGYARSDLANQIDGKGRLAVAEVEAAEEDAAREVEHARTTYDDMKPMLERGFITRVELERAEQTLRRAEEQLKLAQMRQEAMVGFEQPAATARSQATLDSAQQAVSRQRETAKAQLAERDAAVRMAASHVDEIGARVALLQDQIGRSVVRSEASGMVVYRELFFGNDKRKPQVGDEVWSNQPLIALPDSLHLTVESRIREIDMHHVAAGSRVKVTLPAYPGLQLDGVVGLVGALAEQDPSRAGSKFFPITVNLDGHDERLRTGMTAEVEIETSTASHSTLIPVQAIFEVDGHPTVFVAEEGHASARAVVIAAENDREAAIARGVSPGEPVYLADPRGYR